MTGQLGRPRRRPRWPFLLALALLAGCASLRLEPPQVNLLSLAVEDVTLSHINLTAQLRFYNPNPEPLTITEVRYQLELADEIVAEGRSRLPVTVAGGETGTTELRLSSAYWDLFATLQALPAAGQEVRYRISGSVQVDAGGLWDERFPFQRQGLIPLHPPPP
ncbi:MAG: LEA type 2 family protein [Thermodesulfobacteriota bacterium]